MEFCLTLLSIFVISCSISSPFPSSFCSYDLFNQQELYSPRELKILIPPIEIIGILHNGSSYPHVQVVARRTRVDAKTTETYNIIFGIFLAVL
jgi:hypothetical protein